MEYKETNQHRIPDLIKSESCGFVSFLHVSGQKLIVPDNSFCMPNTPVQIGSVTAGRTGSICSLFLNQVWAVFTAGTVPVPAL